MENKVKRIVYLPRKRVLEIIDEISPNLKFNYSYNYPLMRKVNKDLLDKENKLVSLLKKDREAGVDPSELRLEDDVEGFAKEVYWIKHAGETKLDKPMFLRPTSETAM